MSTNAEWVSVSIKLPEDLQETLTQVNDILDVVSTTLEVTATLLETLKTFLVDVSNPLAALVSTLLDLVETILTDLNNTGLYLYADLPKSSDQGFGANLKGGMPAWRGRMGYALLSPDVSNRPNFGSSASVVSFHLVVTSGDIGKLMSSFGFLMALFKQKASPNMNPPKNFQVRSVNEEFYKKYYVNGYINNAKIKTEESRLVSTTTPLTEEFLSGGGAVSIEDLDLVLRYDWLTGEEYILDKFSGGILANGGIPDTALLTWKLDQKLIPNSFRIERTETQGGKVKTYSAKDSSGTEVAKNEKLKDEEGEPVREAETIDTMTVDYGYGKTMTGASHEMFEYLDTTVESGKSYWYRVVPVYGSQSTTTFPTIDPSSSDVAKKIDQILKSILKATSGEGIPSEFKGVYIPSESESDTARALAFQSASKTGGKWWTGPDFTGDGWTKVGIGDLFDPVLLAAKEVETFVKSLNSSIEGVVDQIISFINLLETKIHTIDTFISVLQSIISLLEVFEAISFGCLYVTTDQGTQGVLEAINDDSLEGTPASGSDDYVASMTILGGTVGVAAAINSVKLLFGL